MTPGDQCDASLDVLDLLACPVCHAPLRNNAGQNAIVCEICRISYPVQGGIPVLAPSVADKHKREQAEFFDREPSVEFEITRPDGTTGFYSWLLGEKFRRSIATIRSEIPDATVLCTCAGSGLDAEYLARIGAANVVAADISLGAAKRTLERARRRSLAIIPVVADAERLPFADGSFDVSYVHDGLHHLQDPDSALREMARVSRRAISVNEPARAGLTAVAARVGLAEEREESGNRIHRLLPAEISNSLRGEGFEVLCAVRYGMYYKHHPGWPSRLLSVKYLTTMVRAMIQAVNRVFGAFGNKLTVQAIRPPAADTHQSNR